MLEIVSETEQRKKCGKKQMLPAFAQKNLAKALLVLCFDQDKQNMFVASLKLTSSELFFFFFFFFFFCFVFGVGGFGWWFFLKT